MKLLGRGWQYSVYDLHNGRVFKKRNSRLVAYWCMFKSYLQNTKDGIPKFENYYHAADSNIRDSFRTVREMNIDPATIGNPLFYENSFNYEQDFVMPVSKRLEHVSIAEAKDIVDRFIVFIDELIGLRFVDKSFNMGANFGIRDDGSFVVSDIGEIYSNLHNIQKEIQRRPWAQPYVFMSLPAKEIRDYFIEAMDAHFNVHEK